MRRRRRQEELGETRRLRDGDKDYRFAFKGLKAGKNQVRFQNTGKELHHALLFPYNKGATLADVKKFVAAEGESGPPPFDGEKGTGTAVIDGGIAQNVELDLRAGKYVALCFIPTARAARRTWRRACSGGRGQVGASVLRRRRLAQQCAGRLPEDLAPGALGFLLGLEVPHDPAHPRW